MDDEVVLNFSLQKTENQEGFFASPGAALKVKKQEEIASNDLRLDISLFAFAGFQPLFL